MISNVIDRRAFLRVGSMAGTGFVLECTLASEAAGLMRATAPAAIPLSVFVSITPGGVVEIISKNPEIGQGAKTALPMILAEELDCDWSSVKVIQAGYDPAEYGDQFAGGSLSVTLNWMRMRQAGAVARQMLLQAAANMGGVAIDALTTEPGVVVHAPSYRRWTYGELAAAAAKVPLPDPSKVQLKDPAAFRIVGTRKTGVDSAAITAGAPLFGIDVRLPGQLYAIYETAPAHGGKLKSVDTTAAAKAPGVVAVVPLKAAGGKFQLVDGVAIVATNYWYAEQARALLKADWDLSASKGHSTGEYDARARGMFGEAPHTTLRRDGDPAASLAQAAKVVSAQYSYPYVAHAPLEPQNCTALWKDGVMEIWAPTQNPGQLLAHLDQALGIKPSGVKLHMTRCGGGFGRRLENNFAVEAAAIAMAIPGRPVQLQYSRSDDLKRDFYRAGGYHSFQAGLDAQGKLVAFACHFVTFGADGKAVDWADMSPANFPAGLVPNLSYTRSMMPTVLPTGPLRAPQSNAHAYVFQAFLDEVAEAAGTDLPSLMLELCSGEKVIVDETSRFGPFANFSTTRARNVIDRVIADSNWHQRPKGNGRGFGFGFYFSHFGYFAEVVDVSVSNGGLVVNKVWVVGDVGSHLINPAGAEAQVRGCVIDGLAHARSLAVTFVDGRPEQSNFDGFQLGRMSATPEIAISWLHSQNPPTGLGEPAFPPVIPALTNAIHAATGKRIRNLPINM